MRTEVKQRRRRINAKKDEMRNRETLVWVFSSREKAQEPKLSILFVGRQKQTTLPESFKNYNFYLFIFLCVFWG